MTIRIKKFIKAFLRSRSINFAIEFGGGNQGKPLSIKILNWKNLTYHYRTGTSDSFVAYECFLHGKKNAYMSPHLPRPSSVRTIVDVGANVGASVLFWHSIYPDASIYCFEPVTSNFEILQLNIQGLSDVQAYNEALGDTDGELTFIHSPSLGNEGGWSAFQRGAQGDEMKIPVPVRKSGGRLLDLGIAEIDILKVDTEGAEKMIVSGLGDNLLSKTRYICGELHGERDFEFLDFLESKGFLVGARKSPKSKLFNFEAIRN